LFWVIGRYNACKVDPHPYTMPAHKTNTPPEIIDLQNPEQILMVSLNIK